MRRVEFLVRQHLVMGQMSQRRDLDDIGMISDFAAAVRRRGEPARALPAHVLRSRLGGARRDVELEGDAARRALHDDADVPAPRARTCSASERAEIVDRAPAGRGAPARRGAAEASRRRRWRRCSAGFPARYFAENIEARIATHVRLIRARRAGGQELARRGLARRAAGDDRDGAGGAATRPACSPRWRASSTRTGSRSSTPPSTRASRPTRARRPRRSTSSACATAMRPPGDRRGALEEGARRSGGGAVGPGQGGDAGGGAPARRLGRRLADAGRAHRVQDRQRREPRLHRRRGDHRGSPGVLYAITRTLFIDGLDIHRSKIATEANRAIDVFYVRDKATLVKITDPERVRRLRETSAARACSTDKVDCAPMPNALRAVLLVACWRSPTGGGAAPLLEKGERLFRQGDIAGALAAFDEAAKVDPQGRAPALPEGRRAREEGGRAGRGRRLQAGDRAQGRLRRGAQQPGRAADRARRRGRRRGRARGGRAGQAGLRRGAVQPGRRARRARQEAGGGRRLQGGGAAQADRRRLPPEPGRGAAAHGRRRRARSPRSRRRPGSPRATPIAWADLGMVLSDKKSYPTSAQAALDKATKLKPDFALAWNRLGRVALKRGQVSGRGRGRRSGPASSSRKNGAFAADLCRALFEQKEAARAAAECHAAVELDPKNPLAPLRADEGAGRQGGLPGRQGRAGQFQGAPGRQARGQAAGRRHRRHLHQTRRH